MLATMTLEEKFRTLKVSYEQDEYESFGMIPWFNYTIKLPSNPLPAIEERPHIKTERLLVRPFVTSDLEAFHEFRSIAETQNHSTTRGRPDRDLEESRQNLENLTTTYADSHWWFGAWLQSTGELIGEGGLPDVDGPRSGRPEAEILIKPAYWRQGYGTELWKAVTSSWWELPREPRRHQLFPVFVPQEKEPGDPVEDGMGFVWEETNIPARHFFNKMLGQAPIAAAGFFVDFDHREGREGNLVKWEGTLASNPRETE
ncbi:acyl-CoA N-acyltransferase [Xylariales sp. PMI_506]|nr:acyl-CoA N-acyltransferase [Xylariales sp. PMI_506]